MTAMTRQAERVGYQTLLAQATNIDGDQSLLFEVPSGYGEVEVADVHLVVSSIATMATNPELVGPAIAIVSTGDSNERDFVDVTRWVKTAAGILEAATQFRRGQYLRPEESLIVRFAEVDTNASPTADLDMLVRVKRLTP